MAFDLDRFWKEDYDKFHIPEKPGMDHLQMLAAEKLLISFVVLQRMGVKCDDLLESARNTLASAYVTERGAEGVRSADILAQRFERQLNAALDTAMGEQRSR